MLAASFITLPCWGVTSEDNAEAPFEAGPNLVEIQIDVEESGDVIFPVFEILDVTSKDLREIKRDGDGVRRRTGDT